MEWLIVLVSIVSGMLLGRWAEYQAVKPLLDVGDLALATCIAYNSMLLSDSTEEWNERQDEVERLVREMERIVRDR